MTIKFSDKIAKQPAEQVPVPESEAAGERELSSLASLEKTNAELANNFLSNDVTESVDDPLQQSKVFVQQSSSKPLLMKGDFMTNKVLKSNELQQIGGDSQGVADEFAVQGKLDFAVMSNHPYNQVMIDETISSRRGARAKN